jgi:hypothetical protein
VNFKTESLEELSDLLSNKKIDFEVRNKNIIALINEENIPLVIEDIVKNNISIQEVRQMRTLEELFLGLTQ